MLQTLLKIMMSDDEIELHVLIYCPVQNYQFSNFISFYICCAWTQVFCSVIQPQQAHHLRLTY